MTKAARVVVVTGGANGIGWATCQRFSQAGDHVIVADRDGAAAMGRAAELGGANLGIGCDISNESDIRALVARCLALHSRIDVLVNNAGVLDGAGVPVAEQRQEDLIRLLSVNLVGTHVASQAVGAVMRGQGGGVIVNLASCAGFVAAPLRSGYGATKAAIMALTEAMAEEWSADGVCVSAIAPGYIRTDLFEALVAKGKVDPAMVEARIPLGRLGRPKEMAAAIFHLASRAGACLSGQTLVADGGLLAYGGAAPVPERTGPEPLSDGQLRVVVAGHDDGLGRSVARRFNEMSEQVLLMAPEEALAASDDIDVLIDTGSGADWPHDLGRAVNDHLLDRFALATAFGRRIKPGGAVVLVAPDIVGSAPNRLARHVACSAVAMLARSLACEWAMSGVRVNAIAPRDAADPDDIAATALFLTSSAASYVTGTNLVVKRR